MNAYATPHVRDFLSHFPTARETGNGKFKVCCICHEDENPSADITITSDGTILYYCQSCKAKGADAVKALGLPVTALFPPRPLDYRGHINGKKNGAGKPSMKKPKTLHPTRERAIDAAKFGVSQYEKVPMEKLVASLDTIYQYPDGSEHFSIIRLELPASDRSKPRKFPQPIHPVPGGYHVGDPAGLLSPLNLPALLASDARLFHFEGEGKAELVARLGLLATTSAHGANSADKTDFSSVQNREVVIVPDADDAGEKYAHAVAAKYIANGCTVKILRLPGLNEGEDIVEWVENLQQSGIEDADDDYIRGEIERLADAAPLITLDEPLPSAAPAPAPATPFEVDAVANDHLASLAKLATDAGNAARFAIQHGRDLRYVQAWGRWMQWRAKRWAEDDCNFVVKLAIKTALSIYKEAADEEDEVKRQKLIEWARTSQSRQHLNAMIDLAKAYLPATPDQFDADPDLLNAQNCTIDLRTGRERPHQREDYLTKICRASFAPTAAAPIFTAFLARIFRTYPKLIDYVQRAIGYGAQGMTIEQVLFFLYGSGANGKTTLLDAVMFAMGDYAGKADRDLLAATDGNSHPTNIADLKGKRLVVCAETNEGGRFDEAKLKDLVGETRVKARFMRQDFFEFSATHKVFLYSNHKPMVRGTDYGFWRRMRVIPFIERIGDEEKDRGLPAKLQNEADGILAWVVEGCRRWRSEGLGMPEEVREATDGYRVEMDSIGAFLAESVLEGERMEATASHLYAEYGKWCEDNGEKPLSQKRLGTCLSERGFRSERDSYTGRKKWIGIGLKTTPENTPETGY